MALDSARGTVSSAALYRAYGDLRRSDSDVSARGAASALGVREVELAAARCAGGEGTRLEPAPAPLLERIAGLGAVQARSQNRYASLESTGTYGPPDIGEHTGIVIGDNIDLRIFPSGWVYAYALSGTGGGESLPSIEIFDGAGASAHAVALRPESDRAAYARLVEKLSVATDGAPLALEPETPGAEQNDAEIDVPAFRRAFAAMGDTHDFFMLLRRFGLGREQGLRLAEPAFARPLARAAHRQLFARATVEGIPLMLFVSTEGMVQISSGLVPAATEHGRAYGLLAGHFNLHLNEDGVAHAWAVRKPTVNGIVTSLELYDAAGALIVQVFGERHEGAGERADWARAVASLPEAT